MTVDLSLLPEVQDKNFPEFEDKIGITFRHPDYLVQAFVHRSYLNEHRDFPLGQNERQSATQEILRNAHRRRDRWKGTAHLAGF